MENVVVELIALVNAKLRIGRASPEVRQRDNGVKVIKTGVASSAEKKTWIGRWLPLKERVWALSLSNPSQHGVELSWKGVR